MVQQTVQFETVSLSEVGSGALTAFLFSGASLVATLASITENGTLKGRYTGTVEDIAAGDYRLVVKFNGYTVSEPDEAVSLLLAVGTYVSKRLAELNTATQGQIDAMTRGLIAGVVGSSSSTTVVNVTSTESGLAVTDQLKGRVIIFNKDTTTAALRGQGAPIDTNDTTSITVASGDAFTTAPASGDTFTIY